MENPTVERRVETRFFKKHRKHMPALLNIKKKKEESEEIARDLTAGID